MIRLLLLVAMFFSAAGRAQEEDLPRVALDAPVVGEDADQPAPVLVRLESSLMKIQAEKERGLIDETRYREYLKKFRVNLASEMIRIKPTPADTVLHASILSRLGDTERAQAILGATLARDPASPAVRVALGQVHYDRKDYASALAEANVVLARDPANKGALALKHSSAGRVRPGGAAPGPDTQGIPAGTLGVGPFRASPAKGDGGLPRAQAAIGYINSSKAALTAGRGEEALAWARKATETYPAPEVLRFAKEVGKIVDSGKIEELPEIPVSPASEAGGIPLWPIFPVFGLGAASFAVAKSRKTIESEDGFNEEDRPQPGELQRFMAGSILAGLAGAGLYVGGAYMVSAAVPAAARFMSGAGQQVTRLAQSQAGALNLGSGVRGTAYPSKAVAEEAADIVQQVVIKKGEILNRVWHSEWASNPGLSRPEGLSYCRGSCLPLNTDIAIKGRGLTVGVVNNAKVGALFRVREDILVTVRRSIGGYEQEILLRSPADIQKLELMKGTASNIPSGK